MNYYEGIKNEIRAQLPFHPEGPAIYKGLQSELEQETITIQKILILIGQMKEMLKILEEEIAHQNRNKRKRKATHEEYQDKKREKKYFVLFRL